MSFALEQVCYAYGGSRPLILRDLSVIIRAGKTTAILGVSGCGKTTLLNLLGLLWETHGRGRFSGHLRYTPRGAAQPLDYAALGNHERALLRRVEFGFVPQSCYLLPYFTCAQNIAMPLALQNRSLREQRERVEHLLQTADPTGKLLDRSRNLPAAVSGGERQRMAVLRAIVHEPSVVFADEPVSNLDEENTVLFLEVLRRWRKGVVGNGQPAAERTLLLVCHDPMTAAEMADDCLFLYPDRSGDPAKAGARGMFVPRESLPEDVTDRGEEIRRRLRQPVGA